MKTGVNFVRRVVANVAIAAVVVCLFALSVTGTVITAEADNSPVYKGANTKKVSLMVNVYWGTEYIDGMLETFKANGVTTTFFVRRHVGARQ